MNSIRFAFSVACLAVAADAISAEDYPNKPIRIVTLEAGNGLDVTARLLAEGITRDVGQQVIVDNRGGASGIIAAQTVAKASADGYTLLFYGNPLWILPLLKTDIPYDPLKDFTPIAQVTSSPLTLVVNPSVPAQSVKDLIALAKTKPGEINYGSAGAGTTNHLGMELFRAMAGINIAHVPYKGTGPALNDLMGGQVQVMLAPAGTWPQYVKSGRLRALAVTSAQSSALAPGLPTVAAGGLPGFELGNNYGVFGPAAIPKSIVDRLNLKIVQILSKAEIKERLFILGMDPVGSSSEQFAAKIRSEMSRMGKVIADAHIHSE